MIEWLRLSCPVVINEDIDSTERLLRTRGEIGDGGSLSEVAIDIGALHLKLLPQERGCPLTRYLRYVGDDHRTSEARKSFTDTETDTACAACDEDLFTFE